jgi:O-antigen/teichoic acid export membrane protein
MSFINQIRSKLNFFGDDIKINNLTNLIWMFSDKGVKLISELFVGIFVARYLGVDSFGLLNFAISYITIFFGISSLGLSELLAREFFNYSSRHKKIIGSAFTLKFGLSILIVVLINASASLLSEGPSSRTILLLVSFTIIARSFDVVEFYFQSKSASHKIAKIHIISNLITSFFKIFFVFKELDVTFFAAVYSLEWFLNALGFIFLYSKEEQIKQWIFDKRISLYLLRNSWYMMLSALAVDLYMRMDQVMIRQMIGNSENGLYSAATKISEVWYAIPVVICSVLFPVMLKSKLISEEEFNTRTLQILSFMFWVSFLISFIITPFSKPIVEFLFTEEYSKASSVLSIHIWASVFVFWGVTSSYWLLAMNLQSISLIRTIIGLVFNGLLNLILIPKFGIQGAAIATLISQSIASSISLMLIKRTRPIFYLQLQSIILPLTYIRKHFK